MSVEEPLQIVDKQLLRFGILPVFGQLVVPSVADLLAGRAVRSKGYSRLMRPAWDYVDWRLQQGDVVYSKLLQGRRCLIHRSMYRTLDAIAVRCMNRLATVDANTPEGIVFDVVDKTPGIPGNELKLMCIDVLGIGASSYTKARSVLESRSCIFGLERSDVHYHTHEQSWYSWNFHPVRRSFQSQKPMTCEQIRSMFGRKFPGLADREIHALFPALRFA